jgi:hypothetical protein
LKLPQLLSQFLYQTRKLDLPGIGSFTLDSDVVIPQESDKIGQVAATGIHFKNANIPAPADELINFLKEHTGKMKSLTASDLDFFLTTGRQLLNIGKPFYLDGIGTLIKTKDGRLDFTPGEYMVARLEDSGPERRVSYDEPQREKRESPKNYSARQAFLLIGIIGGLIVIGWGGYYLYKRNNYAEPVAEKQAVVIPDSTLQKDSNAVAGHSPADTMASTPVKSVPAAPVPAPTSPTATAPPALKPAPAPTVAAASVPVPEGASLYHFVILATSNKNRALRRYNQLLGYQLNIKMDQKDSAWFKLYFPIAAPPRDTTQIKDSLADVYAAPHVFIEH